MANLFNYYDPEDRERDERQFEQDCQQNHDQLKRYRLSGKWNKLHELANKGFQEANKRKRGKRWPILDSIEETDHKDLPQLVCILFAFADYYQQLQDLGIYNKPWISPEMRVEFEDVISELRKYVTFLFGPQDEVDIFTRCMVEVKKHIGTDHKKTVRKKTSASGKSGDMNETQEKDEQIQREPLSENAVAVYELLKGLPQHRGLKGREILEKLEHREKPIIIDQSTLTKNIIPALRPYGVKNKPGAGYFISK